MKEILLGKTNTKVSVIGAGNAHYPYNDPYVQIRQAVYLEFANAMGVNFIDTAESYGDGLSEEAIGKVRDNVRKNMVISTKVSPTHLLPEDLRKSVENSLLRLRVDHIGLYYIHWPSSCIPIEQTMQVMGQLVDEGKIRYLGLSNFSLKKLKEAIAVSPKEISAVQMEYNLYERGIEKDLLPFCQDQKITLVAFSPLNQGGLVKDSNEKIILEDLGIKYGKTLAQITLNWLISHSPVVVIPKTENPVHLLENAVASDFTLSSEDIELIDKTFTPTILDVPVEQIRVISEGRDNRQVYKTLEEAKQNALGSVPSPKELAQEIREGEMLKSVRVIPTTDMSGRYKYDLIEGRIRYWAWVIAFKGKRPIPVLLS